SRGDAFYITSTNITGSEDSGLTGFQQIRSTSERPARASQLFRRKIRASFNEAAAVEHDATLQPAGVGVRARHYEHMSDVLVLTLAGCVIPPRGPLHMVDAFEADKFRVSQQADVRRLFNATNEVFRHCVSEAGTPDEHVHVL